MSTLSLFLKVEIIPFDFEVKCKTFSRLKTGWLSIEIDQNHHLAWLITDGNVSHFDKNDSFKMQRCNRPISGACNKFCLFLIQRQIFACILLRITLNNDFFCEQNIANDVGPLKIVGVFMRPPIYFPLLKTIRIVQLTNFNDLNNNKMLMMIFFLAPLCFLLPLRRAQNSLTRT